MKKIILNLITVAVLLATACNKEDKTVAVDGVTVNPMSLSMVVGNTESISASVTPENASNKEIVWTSSNKEVATVDDGRVTAVSQGEVKIAATTVDGGYRTSCIVTVYTQPVAVTGVTFDVTELKIEVGKRYPLAATVLPESATDKYLTWRSDNVQSARVTPSGIVEALEIGESTITATARDGGHRATCVVTVVPGVIHVSGITLDKGSLNMELGSLGGETLTATLAPANAENKEVEWTSSNPAVAAVNPAGAFTAAVTAGSVGSAVITVTAKDGGLTATCNVSVVNGSGINDVALNPGDDLRTAIAGNPGKTLVLPSGYTYTWSGGQNIPAGGIWVKGDPGAAVKPVITVTTGTAVNLNGRIAGEIVRFENVDFVVSGLTGAYFINQGTNATDNICNIKELSFENCRFSGFGRSIVRTQIVGQTFELVKFNNCIIENGSNETGQNYALIQSTVAGVTAFKSIVITNSTVNNMYASFLNVTGNGPSAQNILIENVTFYKTVGSNSSPAGEMYLVNAGTGAPVNITIRKCILGSVKGVGNERGIQMHTGGVLTAESNYATADWTVTTPDPPTKLDIPATTYSGNCDALFVNPAGGNFRIKDAGFAGTGVAGDPRWW